MDRPTDTKANPPAVVRQPGRPRSATAHAAILDAAVALFVERGSDGISMEAVAAMAGVGKATIYRRWSSKEDLVVDAVARVFTKAVRPDTGTVRQDLIESARELHRLMSSSLTGRVFPRMATEIAHRSPLGRLYGERIIGPRRAVFEEALRRGIERGELPEAIDLELAIDQLVGTLLLRKLTGRLKRSDPAVADRAVDMLLTGLGAGGA
ncbi:MAG TPA: TetR/AcrR family transcriptional regulator [Actinomycetota bacterium]|jgi:AcrR family transcriptional regulator